jgi:MFS family permease
MVLLTQLGLAGSSGVLVFNALLPHPQLWVLFVVAAVSASLIGFQRPSLDALTPRLVERDELMAAGALDSLRFNFGMIVGPAVGGVLIATIGLAGVYAIDIGTFLVSLVMLGLMRAVPPPPEAERPSLRRIAEGFRYARSRPELLGTYGVDIVAMFFGMPSALFPALAQEFGGASVLGLLYAAPSVGSLVATTTSGWTQRVHRHGLGVIMAAAVWGLGVLLLGLAPTLPLALAALALAGAADMVSGIFRSTIWNQTIPDRLRGRLAGIEQVSYSTGPLLGDLEAGVVGSLAGVRVSIVSGGALCIVGVAAAALLLPAFRRYDARTFVPEPATA